MSLEQPAFYFWSWLRARLERLRRRGQQHLTLPSNPSPSTTSPSYDLAALLEVPACPKHGFPHYVIPCISYDRIVWPPANLLLHIESSEELRHGDRLEVTWSLDSDGERISGSAVHAIAGPVSHGDTGQLVTRNASWTSTSPSSPTSAGTRPSGSAT